jgi:predicted RNA-binding Zn ribbon-like protein
MAIEFGQSAGSLALDLANTVDWRDDPARRADLIPTAARFGAWARHVGFPAAAPGCRLPGRLARAVALREILATLLTAAAKGRPLPAAALADLTTWNQDAWRRRTLSGARRNATWSWHAGVNDADRLLFTIALDAAELLVSANWSRLRVCAGAGCGWFFFDRSKAGRRRWCNMEVCGNRVKVRSYRARVSHE